MGEILWKKKFFFKVAQEQDLHLTIDEAKEDKLQGRYMRIDSLDWSEKPMFGWVKGLEFPVIFHHQTFKNKDGSTGLLYLISNDVDATKATLETTYQKRWCVEVFHKNIKSIRA
ncbi:MAG: hypothetical protein KAG06_00550 [Methylococcales bacterium]|nr:hypothetical protein [Methylococcales bacterium]